MSRPSAESAPASVSRGRVWLARVLVVVGPLLLTSSVVLLVLAVADDEVRVLHVVNVVVGSFLTASGVREWRATQGSA